MFGCQCQCQSDYQYCSGSESTVISTSVGQEHGQDRGLDGLVWVLRYARCGFSVLYVHYTTHISHVVCTVLLGSRGFFLLLIRYWFRQLV